MGNSEAIDVICQHCKDGSIIPIKIRVQDEEQIYHTYMIKSYLELASDEILLPNELTAPETTVWCCFCHWSTKNIDKVPLRVLIIIYL